MKKIVICDDDTESINYMKKLLENYISARKAQCEILYYRSGKELLEAENIAIDTAVLDVEMDGINGIQTGYEVQKRYPDAILMITTAYMKYLDDGPSWDSIIKETFNEVMNVFSIISGL